MAAPTSKGLAAAAAAVLLLAGCASISPAGDPVPVAIAESEPTGAYLIANGTVFDPVAHDVDDTSICDGEPGRTILEEFDRASWGAFDLPAGDALMTCGHANGAGWLHIADGHTGDYGEIADLVDSSWEDVAWFAIDQALQEPTKVEQYSEDIANYLVLLEYVGDDGEVEQAWNVVVGVGLTSEKIITSFPRDLR